MSSLARTAAPWLKGGAEGPVPIPVELPDASQAAGGMAEA